jgi:hypothetical protein
LRADRLRLAALRRRVAAAFWAVALRWVSVCVAIWGNLSFPTIRAGLPGHEGVD